MAKVVPRPEHAEAEAARSADPQTMAVGHVETLVGDSSSTSQIREDFLSPEERELLARAQAGDQRALRSIYDRYQSQVRGHLFRLLGPDPDVDDLVQTVFARAFVALSGFRGSSTLSTWLYRITANSSHNLLRQRFRRERVTAALHWLQSDGRHVLPERVQARDEAQRVLRRLHPDLRQVFVLYNYEGLTLQEISTILHRPISTVGDRLTRARKKLKELVS
jgi:RNA polymerase sigma-70 factor (ECF subfamily)